MNAAYALVALIGFVSVTSYARPPQDTFFSVEQLTTALSNLSVQNQSSAPGPVPTPQTPQVEPDKPSYVEVVPVGTKRVRAESSEAPCESKEKRIKKY